MLIKICGNTNEGDAMLSSRHGADYLGVIVEHTVSPRSVNLEVAERIHKALLERDVQTPLVAVTVNLPLSHLLLIRQSFKPEVFQLHGDEDPECVSELVDRGARVWATCGDGVDPRARIGSLLDAGAEAIVVDARAKRPDGQTVYGGTGRTSNWDLARELSDSGVKVVLSGGLNPMNVTSAILATNPWMVDAVSSLEAMPGVKDGPKVRAFIEAIRK